MWLHSGRVNRNGRISGSSVSFSELFVGVIAVLVGAVWLWSSSWGWTIFVALGVITVLPLVKAYAHEQRRAEAIDRSLRDRG